MKIMLLDDDVDMLETLVEALELDDHIVLAGASGVAGIQLLEQSDSLPDLILSDMNMPQMNGLEFIKAVKANETWQSIPIHIISGFQDDKDAALAAGAAGFLVKPFQFAQLEALLK